MKLIFLFGNSYFKILFKSFSKKLFLPFSGLGSMWRRAYRYPIENFSVDLESICTLSGGPYLSLMISGVGTVHSS